MVDSGVKRHDCKERLSEDVVCPYETHDPSKLKDHYRLEHRGKKPPQETQPGEDS